MSEEQQANKAHHKSKATRGKKATQQKHGDNNFKAFSVANVGRRQRETQRQVDRSHKKHVVEANKAEVEALYPPPVTVVVQGPKGCGKTTLVKCLVKHWTKQNLLISSTSNDSGFGPISVIPGRNRRLSIIECPSDDVCSMVDLSKVADLVLLLVNSEQGLELASFEMLNCLQTHGMCKVIAVMTHLDKIRDLKKQKKLKKSIKSRLWTETYDGAKVFYLSQLRNGKYMKNEITNLARFVTLAKFRPLRWKNSHSYLLCDRMEDVTPRKDLDENENCDRKIVLFGYLRGISLRTECEMHLCGMGDIDKTKISISVLEDPLPMGAFDAKKEQRKRLKGKDPVLYAPMANIGNVTMDRDAVYITLPSNNHFSREIKEGEEPTEGVRLVKELQKGVGYDDDDFDAKNDLAFPNKEESNSKSKGITLFKTDDDEKKNVDEEESDYDDDDDDSGSSEDESDSDDELRQKVLRDANNALQERRQSGKDLMHLVYASSSDDEENNVDESDEDGDEFFKVKGKEKESKESGNLTGILKRSSPDKVNESLEMEGTLVDWENREECEMFKNRFVTGGWQNIEDMEIAENEDDDTEEKVVEDLEDDEKIKKKEMFDKEYDEEKTKTVEKPDKEVDLDDDYLKENMTLAEKQKQLNRDEFSTLDLDKRAEHEGFRPGSYLRIEIDGVYCEFVKNFSKKRPLLLGSLSGNTSDEVVVKARMKKHRWFPKSVLKTNDPLVFSFGWRRFQSAPLYFLEDENQRQRMLKYTPEHMHCNAMFLGKETPLNTPFVCFQDIREQQKTFRIAATGVSLQSGFTSDVRKKLKLVGEAYEIQKNTCFIKKMFSSSMEVAKFEGARVQTVSGIRGVIKKAVKEDGCFRATFEDKVLMSDIIFCKTWVKVDVVPLFNPIKNLLQDEEKLRSSKELDKSLMKTVAQIRFSKNETVPVLQDSLYKPIERKEKKFKDFRLSKKLEKQLPFKDRPKYIEHGKKAKDFVIQTAREKKVTKLLKKLNEIKKVKDQKEKESRSRNWEAKKKKERKFQEQFLDSKKEDKKRKFRDEGLKEKRKQAKLLR